MNETIKYILENNPGLVNQNTSGDFRRKRNRSFFQIFRNNRKDFPCTHKDIANSHLNCSTISHFRDSHGNLLSETPRFAPAPFHFCFPASLDFSALLPIFCSSILLIQQHYMSDPVFSYMQIQTGTLHATIRAVTRPPTFVTLDNIPSIRLSLIR